ncbi:MAG: hypothetical protein ABSF67_14665 [Roseiarcus sp.]
MLVTVEGRLVRETRFVPMDVLRWQRIEVNLSAATTLDEALLAIGSAFESALSDAGGRPLAVRLALTGATSAHGELIASSEAVEAECDALALTAPGEIWIERIQIDTQPSLARPADGEDGALSTLIGATASDAAETADFRRSVEPRLQKAPVEIRREAGLDPLTDERFASIVADADALLRHRLSFKAKR